MPEITIADDGSFTDGIGFDGKSEPQRQEEAKAALIEEQFGAPQPLILGKFRNPEDLATSYQSLESETGRLRARLAELEKGGTPPAPTGEAAAPETPAAPDAPATPPPAGEAPPPAPPGQPPAATVPPETQEAIRSSILTQCGGEEEYARLQNWAGQNLSQDRIEQYNQALMSGQAESVLVAIKAIQFDMLMQRGYEPKLFGGSVDTGTAGLKPFRSQTEVTAAMNDPRYQGGNADPAYIAEVEQRMAISDVF